MRVEAAHHGWKKRHVVFFGKDECFQQPKKTNCRDTSLVVLFGEESNGDNSNLQNGPEVCIFEKF